MAELLIAMVVTAVICGAAASMLITTSWATETRIDLRHSVVHGYQIEARLRNEINASHTFLAKDATRLVLWLGDDNSNGSVNLGELGLIEYVSGSSELRFHTIVWPVGWSQEQIDTANVVYTTAEDFLARTDDAKTAGYFPATVFSSQIGAMTLTLDNATVLSARLATMRFTLASDDLQSSLVVVCSLRIPTTPP